MSQTDKAGEAFGPSSSMPWGEAALPMPTGTRLGAALEWVMLGAVVATSAVVAVGIGMALATARIDVESRTFADEAVGAVAPAWDRAALVARADPVLAANAAGRIDPLFDTLRVSARDAANQGCKGRGAIRFRGFSDPKVTADYDCVLATEAGQVDAKLSLVRGADRWLISGFDVTPAR